MSYYRSQWISMESCREIISCHAWLCCYWWRTVFTCCSEAFNSCARWQWGHVSTITCQKALGNSDSKFWASSVHFKLLNWNLAFLSSCYRALHLAVLNARQEVVQSLLDIMASLPESFVSEYNFLRQVSHCFILKLLIFWIIYLQPHSLSNWHHFRVMENNLVSQPYQGMIEEYSCCPWLLQISSFWAPWLDMMPLSFHTSALHSPVSFSALLRPSRRIVLIAVSFIF